MLYWLFIPIAGLIISGVNILCETAEIWYIFVATFASIAAVLIIDALTATLVRWLLPKKWFGLNAKIYDASKKKCKFYEKLGIKKWKDKIPELGSLTGFRKNKILDPKNNEFIERFIIESHYGIGVHFIGMIFGFLIIFIFPLNYWYCFGLPVGIVNFVYNLLSFMILRYNLPKLKTLHKYNLRHAVKKPEEKIEEQRSA
ncbi:MAG: hypothetical protein IJY57_04475 [Clostridia bacterium]|nr:hypothetical protein [Clostridia bacterium]